LPATTIWMRQIFVMGRYRRQRSAPRPSLCTTDLEHRGERPATDMLAVA
jgi:hypothetical protein